MWLYYILKNNGKTKFTFKMKPLVIYRRSGTSLTTSTDNANQIRFLDDLYVFRKYMLRKERNLFAKLFLSFIVWESFLMKHRFDASKSISRVVGRYIQCKHMLKGRKKTAYQESLEIVDNYLNKETYYVNYLKERCAHFMKEIEYDVIG